MLKSSSPLALATCLLATLASIHLLAQAPTAQTDMIVDAATRAAVINGALRELRDSYVSPDVAATMIQAVRKRQQLNEYESIDSARMLADTLTAHLRELSRDQHLAVEYSANAIPTESPVDTKRRRQEERLRLARSNFGFFRAEYFGPNFGYLDLRAFAQPEDMAETAAAAMNFLSNVETLIVDLRMNTGGSPDGVAMLASYLFERDPVRLNDIYDRRSGQTRSYWTLRSVPGKRLSQVEVYVLTSSTTFSAAEDFAYALKTLKRATIVGETTRGGAHPMSSHRIHDHFFINVPWGRSVNYMTKTSWEGVGVEPDVKVPAMRALPTAQLIVLEKRASKATNAQEKAQLLRMIDRLKKELGS